MISKETFAKEALTWLGTPFHAGAKRKQVGCDCYGFLCGVYEAATGQSVPPLTLHYSTRWPDLLQHQGTFLAHVRHFAKPSDKKTVEAGDILVFSLRGGPLVHAGIAVGNNTFVHALAEAASPGVSLARYSNSVWAKRHTETYHFI